MATGSYAPISGLQMYYEIHGEGKPLLIIPGGTQTIETCFEHLLPAISSGRQVIAAEMQGHGRTADIDRPLTHEDMADDVGALIAHLGLPQADILGYSTGGSIAIQTAVRHPQFVRRLIVAGATMRDDGWHEEVHDAIRDSKPEDVMGMPWYEAYRRVAPRPDDFPRLFAKMNACTLEPYDWTEAFGALPMPVLILVGDADSVKVTHAVEMFGRLGGDSRDGFAAGRPKSRLAILPGTNHLELLTRVELVAPAISAFLDDETTSSEPFAM
jgi:pimeloyl-ACP methyl ester carboxylesterase